ncbi:hypothetical protein ACFCX0_48900 [Streptomyces sp. NPDC056352]|uniref:hypothetical protein n=1 Tax=Streptomyces sp. NPDC056352 TaxID=3345791 RepID=UPI0035DCC43A
MRPDGEVILDEVAQGQLASWCRVPTGHLAQALPSWAARPAALASHDRGRQGSKVYVVALSAAVLSAFSDLMTWSKPSYVFGWTI